MDLFSDKSPETTVPGTGFKDLKTAKHTLKIMKNRDIDYQFQVINTMYNRGLEVIKRTFNENNIKNIKEALEIFKKWLEDYKKNDRGKELMKYLPLPIIKKFEKLAEYYNISRKSRGLEKSIKSDYGFLEIYKKVKGDKKKLRNLPIKKDNPDGDTWDRYRNSFCKRRISMIKYHKNYKMYHTEGKLKGLPTPMHVVLIMWAYSPDYNTIIKLSDKLENKI